MVNTKGKSTKNHTTVITFVEGRETKDGKRVFAQSARIHPDDPIAQGETNPNLASKAATDREGNQIKTKSGQQVWDNSFGMTRDQYNALHEVGTVVELPARTDNPDEKKRHAVYVDCDWMPNNEGPGYIPNSKTFKEPTLEASVEAYDRSFAVQAEATKASREARAAQAAEAEAQTQAEAPEKAAEAEAETPMALDEPDV